MKLTLNQNILISFLASAVSGICLDFVIYNDESSIVAFLVFCLGMVPFLWCIHQENKSARFAAFLGFSLSISLLVGEGLWSSLHDYYQVAFLPSTVISVGWIWIAGCLHWCMFSLYQKDFLCVKADFLWLLPFGWMSVEFLYGRISIQGQSIALGLLGPLNFLTKSLAKAGGVHGISFLYICLNTFVLALIHPVWRKGIFKKGWIIAFGFLLVMGLVSFPFGKTEIMDKPFRVALLQPNLTISRQIKVDQTTQQRLEKLIGMTQLAFGKKVDLIVWPAAVLSIRDDSEVSYALKLAGEKKNSHTKILVGILRTVIDRTEEKMQNTVYFVNMQGQIENVYVKQKLTPYTEYIPCSFLDFIGRRKQGILPFLSSPKKGLVFESGNLKWGNVICIEIYYPGLMREYVNKGADFLFHFSNDDVFGETHFKKLLVKLSALRAIELGVPIFRESITGVSAYISPEGEILKSLPSGQEGIVYARLTRKSQSTFYARFGDVFSYLSLCVTVWGIWRSRRQKEY